MFLNIMAPPSPCSKIKNHELEESMAVNNKGAMFYLPGNADEVS
jgi:hypothetical protein